MWQFTIWILVGLVGVAVTTVSGFKATDAWNEWKNNKGPEMSTGGKGGDAIASNGGTAIGGDGGAGGGSDAGRGGDGGNATASNNSTAIGGKGGPSGGPGGGDGGKGGDAQAAHPGSTVGGGDGGGGGRGDGRGGKGAESPLKKMFSPEELEQLKKIGVPMNAGAGGNGGNTPEYDRRVRVLQSLSTEFSKKHPEYCLAPMPGVNMPPVNWINTRLEEIKETFRVRLIDNATDFWLDSTEKR